MTDIMLRPGRTTLLLLMAGLLLAGCAKRPAVTQASAPPPTGAVQSVPAPVPPPPAAPAPPPPVAAPPAPPPVAEPAPPPAAPVTPPPSVAQPAPPPPPREFARAPELHDIHFDFDKYAIRADAAKILDANARWLREHPDMLVLVEGHCDERGTNEYNLALGQRRARAAIEFLTAHGVAADRFTLISYGEERPLCTDRTEACWARNRRAAFLVKPR
jgi:peptidoglycan-associated lipoprotein